VRVGLENVAIVERATVQAGIPLSGTLQAVRRATVHAQVTGQVMRAEGEVGQAVRRGQVLLRLEAEGLEDRSLSARAALRSAQAALALARSGEARSRRLFTEGVIARQELEGAERAVALAAAQTAEARARLALVEAEVRHTLVATPLNGVLSRRPVDVGDIVQQGAELFSVVDLSELELVAAVPSAHLPQVKPRTPVRFRVNGYGQRTFEGHVDRIAPAVDASGQVQLFVRVQNPKGALPAGTFADGRLVTHAQTALAVPEDAVAPGQRAPSVLRVTAGTLEQVPVRLGVRDPFEGTVAVLSGLAQGDVVLRGSARELPAGAKVELPRALEGVGGAGASDAGPGE
jgi:RND family efflux transporter MFP subunit